MTGHALKYAWTFTFSHRQPHSSGSNNNNNSNNKALQNQAEYLEQTKHIASVQTIEEFWVVYSHLKRPSDLPAITDFHIFRRGIMPVWEDPANENGGKWIVRLKKGLANRFWEDLILAILGDDLLKDGADGHTDSSDEICGCVLSIRQNEDILSVWTKSAHMRHTRIQLKIRDSIKRALGLLDANVLMEYKCHRDAMNDHSSFRNTDKFS